MLTPLPPEEHISRWRRLRRLRRLRRDAAVAALDWLATLATPALEYGRAWAVKNRLRNRVVPISVVQVRRRSAHTWQECSEAPLVTAAGDAGITLNASSAQRDL